MKQPDTGEKKPILMACLAGLFCILALSWIGFAAPVFVNIFRDFNIDPKYYRLFIYIRWFWTIPLGCLVAGFLIRGAGRWPRKKSLKIDLLAIALVILFFIYLVSISISIPVSGMGEIQTKETAEQNPQETGFFPVSHG